MRPSAPDRADPPVRACGRRRAPVERVRDALAERFGPAVAAAVPDGYQRLGSVLLVRLPPSLEPYRAEVGQAWARVLGVRTVVTPRGPIEGEGRRPRLELLAGSDTVTTVVEHGLRYRFDAARQMFAQGNREERQRAGRLVRPGERVADLFAGIGYFTLPIARAARASRVVAVEREADTYGWLVENLRLNGLADRVEPIFGDNRTVPLDPGGFDRIFLGYLPSAIPYLDRAVELANPARAYLHVHTVADARAAIANAEREVGSALRPFGPFRSLRLEGRLVKPYGPGRSHCVVDVELAR